MRRGLAAGLLATAALGYLAAMVVTGAQPVQRQLVAFEAKGVLAVSPERVSRVEVSRGAEHFAFARSGESGWTIDTGATGGAAFDAEAAKRVGMAVQMMHTASPVREIPGGELAGVDTTIFGLDPPRLTVTLYGEPPEPLLTARFGGRNPEDFLDYMRLDGSATLYLMSRFVAAEWIAAMDASGAR